MHYEVVEVDSDSFLSEQIEEKEKSNAEVHTFDKDKPPGQEVTINEENNDLVRKQSRPFL